MMESFGELPDRIRRHLEAITDSSGLPPGDESLSKITENWTAKRRLFVEQREALGMTEEDRFTAEDPRGSLMLTYSGSLICLGPLTETGRTFEYASIKLRADVPDIIVTEGCNLAGEASVDAPVRFATCPIESTSELLFIASFDPSLPAPEQEQRLLEATIFLTNGFVKENQSLTVEGGVDHFTIKSIVQYVAKRNGVTQTLARRLLDDYLTMLESGALLGERVPLGRLGRLFLGTRGAQKARVGHNPSTGEEILIPAKPETAVPRFSFSKHLKERASRVPPERIGGGAEDGGE
jgi:nucleoid DNA-binding protein